MVSGPPIQLVRSIDHVTTPSLVPPGWTTRSGFDLPAAPWDLGHRRWICVGTVSDRATAGDAVAAAARGVGLIVALDLDGESERRLLEDLDRVGVVSDVGPTASGLTAPQAALLQALAQGQTLIAAAERFHVSRRTAHRWLADARQQLGVATTAEAVTRWLANATEQTPPPR